MNKRRVAVLFVIMMVHVLRAQVDAGAETVTRGPYLQVGAPNGVTIRWRTDVPTDSRVRYGTYPGDLALTVDDAALTTEHDVQITGLDPDTKYFYSIGTTAAVLAGGDADHFFRTSPIAGTRKSARIWIIGDSGQANAAAAAVRDAYLGFAGAIATDVWLMLGDNAYNSGTDAEYQAAVFDMYPTLLRNTILWPTRGNHDLLYAGANNDYYDIFSMPALAEAGGLASGTEAYYSFDYANVHFICLDSHGTDRSPGGAMLTWLGQDLAATSQEWIIAYWHHPPYTKGSHDSDNLADSGGRMRDMRENALPILEAGGVDLVLTGHSHSYERSFLLDGHYGFSWTLHDSMRIDAGDGSLFGDGAYLKPTLGPAPHEGAVYAVAGSSSKLGGGTLDHPVMITSLNVLGSLVLDINASQLDATFLDNTGVVRDRFTIVKGMTPTGIGGERALPPLRLLPGSPNPFTFETQIAYAIPSAGHVRLAVYDVEGREIQTLVEGFQREGEHAATWNGLNTRGRRVAKGVYFSVLGFAGERRVKKIVFVR